MSVKRGNDCHIEIKFVPNRDIQTLMNNVVALVLNVPLSFIGIDETNACNNIYNANGSKVDCPLKKDEQYVYKNSFSVLSMYPKISLIVHYALREGNDNVICFEIPAKITK
ncbi:Ecdysteroid-regulated 16 kDa protein [Acromyrmex echinatior]|uniref:Ecdysteroid-regulated 16 kDa protein n=1 Tax=Acromyrmex echinatior TaxID=103372 RepID=F4WPS8_ACREC|nr:Ecdysteroid-regulated 16 kDa protein [Acromyrmex echinatior]